MGKLRRGKKKIGKCKLKNKQRLNKDEPEELKNAPHSFVFYRGSVGENIMRLTLDFRKIMEPFTASSLKPMKGNKMKDFLAVSGLLHVTHMCVFSSTDIGTYLKIVRTPRGPTLYFKILNYSLSKDVISSLKKQLVFQQQFINPPLLVLNNFNGEDVHLKLMTSMLQNMFPTLNLTNINLNNVRRCVLFNYNSSTGEIDFRHYSIKVVPVNISKGIKKMIQNKVPDLSRFTDAADFMLSVHELHLTRKSKQNTRLLNYPFSRLCIYSSTKPKLASFTPIKKGSLQVFRRANILSESEAEDDPEHHVTLPQKISTRGNLPLNQSSVRLIEQGPRMTLQLYKIEEGFLSGEVLYHRNIEKTEEEKAAILERRLEKRRLKEARKKEQEERKKRKELAKQKLKEKSLQGQKQVTKEAETEQDMEDENENDAEWYQSEVGKAPDSDLFHTTQKGLKRKKSLPGYIEAKRKKIQRKPSKIISSNLKPFKSSKNIENKKFTSAKSKFSTQPKKSKKK